MNTKKTLTTITYVYQDIDAYIQQDENTEAIIETFCNNTNKLYSKETTISDTGEYIVEYLIIKI